MAHAMASFINLNARRTLRPRKQLDAVSDAFDLTVEISTITLCHINFIEFAGMTESLNTLCPVLIVSF